MPLSGIKVVDLSQIISGPFCGMLLADFGADVIKVESLAGDASRVGMVFGEGGENPYFVGLNRSKRSITINLKTDEGKDILRRLVKWSDVLIENFRPGVMERLDLGYNDLKKINPGLIYASVSGFGKTGPYVQRPAFDFIAQALSGFMSLNGNEDEPPQRCGLPISDNIVGLYITLGILAALRHRDRSGEGQELTCSLTDALISCFSFAGGAFFATGELPPRTGNDHMAVSPYGVWDTADKSIAVAPSNASNWVQLAKAIGRDDLLEDPRFRTNPDRRKNRQEINRLVGDELKKKTRDEWIDILNKAGVPCGPINNLKEAFEDPQILQQEMLIHSDQPSGKIPMTGFPLKLSKTPAQIKDPAPQLGEQTRNILTEMGYDKQSVDRLLDQKIVSQWDGIFDVDRMKGKTKND